MTFATDLYPAFPYVWMGFAFYVGAMAAGGFGCLNYRLPIIMGAIFTDKMRAIEKKPRLDSLWSVCDSCHQPIGWRGVLPIIGWLSTKGRCPDCGAKVSVAYPVMEFITGMIAVATLVLTLHPALVIVALWLVMIAWLDHDATWIPDGFTVPLALSAIPASLFGMIPISVPSVLLGAASGGFLMFAAQYSQMMIRGEKDALRSVPYGDVTLLAALGAWTGPGGVVAIGLASSVFMLAYVPLYVHGRSGKDVDGYPYGPALCCAGLMAIILESATGHSVWSQFMALVG